MKIFLLLIYTTLLFGFSSQYLPQNISIKCDKKLYKKAFDICYSCKEKHPLIIVYELYGNRVDIKSSSKKELSFRPDHHLPKKCRAYTKDYSHTGFDRGHFAPNASFDYQKKIQKETFLMSNIAPQKPQLNRRLWAKIERFARYQAKKYKKISVVTGVCGNQGRIKAKVGIPTYWYKILFLPNGKQIAFLVPNTNKGMSKAKAKQYLVPIREIERVCRISF